MHVLFWLGKRFQDFALLEIMKLIDWIQRSHFNECKPIFGMFTEKEKLENLQKQI